MTQHSPFQRNPDGQDLSETLRTVRQELGRFGPAARWVIVAVLAEPGPHFRLLSASTGSSKCRCSASTTGRQQVADEAKLFLLGLADRYETGVDIQQVVLQDVNPDLRSSEK